MSRLLAAPSEVIVGDPQLLSGPTPFSDGCGLPGRPSSETEVEATVAVDPRDSNTVVAAWQQDRFLDGGGALSNLVAVSRDGGRSWSRHSVPGLSRCTGGRADRTSDPWLSYGPNGIVYLASIALEFTPDNARVASDSALLVNRSRDGGMTWSDPVSVTSREVSPESDMGTIEADPSTAGRVYALWKSRSEQGTSVYFAQTSDGGVTWSAATRIYSPGSDIRPSGLRLVILDRALVVVIAQLSQQATFRQAIPTVRLSLVALRSDDLGRTWSAPALVSETSTLLPRDPEGGGTIRAPFVPAVGSRGRRIYVAWPEITASKEAHLRVARSNDGGRTWTRATIRSTTGHLFTPTLAVAQDGTVAVVYHDLRNDRSRPSAHDRRMASVSQDGGTRWGEFHLAGPFDLRTAARAGGLFLGDYQGLSADHLGFYAVFALAQPQAALGASDIFVTRVLLSTGGRWQSATTTAGPRTRSACRRAPATRRPRRSPSDA